MYLFWLKLAVFKAGLEEEEELSELENPPPIPPNLKKMDGALSIFSDFFEIDPDLVAAAQQASPNTQEQEKDYQKLIAQLSEKDRIDFLARLAMGELNLDLKLRRHLESLNKSASEPATASPSISELLHLSTLKEKERLQEEARQAVVAHQNKMEKIAREEDAHWKSVYFNLERKTGKSYDLATATLKDLQDLAKFRNQLPAFNDKMRTIRKNYGRSRVLIQRFERNGLL